jgi:hypothetical protein
MFIRLYTGPDGQSHFEDLTAQVTSEFGQTAMQEAESIWFTRQRPGTPASTHTAPRRQYVIGLVGEVEITTGDGIKMRFKPGDVLLAEDITGAGHTTQVVGESMRISAMVPLKDQEPTK